MSTRVVQRTPNLGVRIRLQPLAPAAAESLPACVPQIQGAGWWNAETEAFDLAEVTGRVQTVELVCGGGGEEEPPCTCWLVGDEDEQTQTLWFDLLEAGTRTVIAEFDCATESEFEWLSLWDLATDGLDAGAFIRGDGTFEDGPTVTRPSNNILQIDFDIATCGSGDLTLYALYDGGACGPLTISVSTGV